MNVEYRELPEHYGYRFGSDGTVWSCRPKNGRGQLMSEWRLLKPVVYNNGYLYVTLGKGTVAQAVHRLILRAFVGPCPEGMECCHNDGNRTNNALENLRWGTGVENTQDQKRHGTFASGSRNGNSRLTESQIREIRALLGIMSQAKIGERFGVSQLTISRVANNRTWNGVA